MDATTLSDFFGVLPTRGSSDDSGSEEGTEQNGKDGGTDSPLPPSPPGISEMLNGGDELPLMPRRHGNKRSHEGDVERYEKKKQRRREREEEEEGEMPAPRREEEGAGILHDLMQGMADAAAAAAGPPAPPPGEGRVTYKACPLPAAAERREARLRMYMEAGCMRDDYVCDACEVMALGDPAAVVRSEGERILCEYYRRMYNPGTLHKLWKDLSTLWNRTVYDNNRIKYTWMRPMTAVRFEYHCRVHDKSNGLLSIDEEIQDVEDSQRFLADHGIYLLEHRDDQPTESWTYNARAMKDYREQGTYRFRLWAQRASMPFGQFGVPTGPESGPRLTSGSIGFSVGGGASAGKGVTNEAALAGQYRMAAGYQAPVQKPAPKPSGAVSRSRNPSSSSSSYRSNSSAPFRAY
jgi:hypothetical protein